jgi:C-methyltransferase C-terminal domain/Putative zinc binding domain/Methyltransferase domain
MGSLDRQADNAPRNVFACHSCGGANLKRCLTLGRTPLANSLLRADQLGDPEPTFPLDLAFCPDCTLVQLLESAPPESLFREYFYFSSFSDTMLRHAEKLAGKTIMERGLGPNSLVIEAASNDGYLLQYYKRAGISVLGIEPAHNVAKVARERHGITTFEEFFTNDFARQLVSEGKRASVFHGHNVLAHVPDLNGFVQGIRSILDESTGVAIIEVPYVEPLIQNLEFDTIYHEHLWYFSLTALDKCFARHDLVIADVELMPIHGGSLRIYAVPSQRRGERKTSVDQLLQREVQRGVTGWEYYSRYESRVQTLASSLRDCLVDLKKRGNRIAGYGASAKGSTLLNYSGIGPELLDYIVDRSSVKQGLYTPGTHLCIHHPDRLMQDRPDCLLMLVWNFLDEILAQQAAYLATGGKFIVPIPEIQMLGADMRQAA